MNVALAICIIFCTLIICVFSFFVIVYFSELKREREIRSLTLEKTSNQPIPLLVVDLPKETKSLNFESQNKNKKNIN